MSHHPEQPDAVGWYDDPEGRKGVERYWNGTEWSGAPRKKPSQMSWSGVATIVIGTVIFAALLGWLSWSLLFN